VDEREDPVSRTQRLYTAQWWAEQAASFDLYYGQPVVVELERQEFPNRAGALALLNDMILLPITREVEGVAETYQEHLVMPRGAMGDAVHLALACVHEVDYVLTWNCKHPANVNKIRHITTINRRLGLLTPEILTPRMLTVEDENQ